MTRRKLTRDEIELWHRVAATADRIHPEGIAPKRPMPTPKPARQPAPRIDPFEIGQAVSHRSRSDRLAMPLPDRLAAAPLRMDRKAFVRMTRGKARPEARIDLHGMRMDQAHGVLVRFILTSQAAGRRLVLVITGKGRDSDEPGPIPTPRGVLRHQVPQWLSVPPLAQAVLQVTPAHARHGGQGAYYVYLRRAR